MLPQWYDPILIVGTERTLPARMAALLATLGVDIRPAPLHLNATVTRWEDHELRQALMRLLRREMSLRTFTLRLAILSEQRRRGRGPWGMAGGYMADALVAVLTQYLNPLVLWCQCTPADAADLLLGVQPPGPGWHPSDALDLCTRRHQTLAERLDGYRVLPLQDAAILRGDRAVIDEVVEFCGLTPTAGQLYHAAVSWPFQEGMRSGEEDAEAHDGTVRHGYAHVAYEEEGGEEEKGEG